jgi:2-keto-4-pentenoate hydratase/2-oxohepta-3-ene-1,7-dioic acid hydratase in catechol pathway
LIDAAWLLASGETIARPSGCRLGFEAKLVAVIGPSTGGESPGRAAPIFGYTLVLAWMATPLDGRGAKPVRRFLGASIGPSIVTADEFDASASEILVDRDGQRQGSAPLAPLTRAFPSLIARLCVGRTIRPGQIVGSRAVVRSDARSGGMRLETGAVVEASAPGIGTLRAIVGGIADRPAIVGDESPNGLTASMPERRASLRLLTPARPAARPTVR